MRILNTSINSNDSNSAIASNYRVVKYSSNEKRNNFEILDADEQSIIALRNGLATLDFNYKNGLVTLDLALFDDEFIIFIYYLKIIE